MEHSSRPRILCLHGRGSSAEVFELQARRIDYLLRPKFNLIYLDGIHICEPGPGILPFFEGMEPYFKWTKSETYEEHQDWETILKKIMAAVALGGPFVGVLGFSQGAKVAASLLQQDQDAGAIGLRFGVLASGGYPALATQPKGSDFGKRIKLPTIHVHGLSDTWRSENLELLHRACEENTTQVLEFNGGHHLPLVSSENERLAEMILKTYDDFGKDAIKGNRPRDSHSSRC